MSEKQLEWKDLRAEMWRKYVFPDGSTVFIDQPQELAVSPSGSGGHRVTTPDGVCHYIPSGWIELQWQNVESEPRARW